jgi:hypothetical protein
MQEIKTNNFEEISKFKEYISLTDSEGIKGIFNQVKDYVKDLDQEKIAAINLPLSNAMKKLTNVKTGQLSNFINEIDKEALFALSRSSEFNKLRLNNLESTLDGRISNEDLTAYLNSDKSIGELGAEDQSLIYSFYPELKFQAEKTTSNIEKPALDTVDEIRALVTGELNKFVEENFNQQFLQNIGAVMGDMKKRIQSNYPDLAIPLSSVKEIIKSYSDKLNKSEKASEELKLYFAILEQLIAVPEIEKLDDSQVYELIQSL